MRKKLLDGSAKGLGFQEWKESIILSPAGY